VDRQVYARRFHPATGWDARYQLVDEPGRDPVLVMNASGDAVVAWEYSLGMYMGSGLAACAF
jgi:hypothetical protein